MTNSLTVSIRKFDRVDREDVRRIGCDTAFLGEPLSFCFDDDEILADALTLYFTDYEPDSCFVAVQEDRVIGYVIGTKNLRTMQRIFSTRVIPRLFVKAMLRGAFFRRNARRFLLHAMMSFLKGEFSTSDLSGEYPATLHINIDRSFQRSKVGTRLMEHCLKFLGSEGIAGVHVSTMSEGAKSFFEKLGFCVLRVGKRSYLRYCLGRDLPFYVLGKKL
jgi:ribosomal protein S18 acetylase RimI-like enzyme